MNPSIIRRISTTIANMIGEHEWQRYTDEAYALVRDMHEPTPAMIAAAEGKSGAECWKTMIDQILAEEPTRE